MTGHSEEPSDIETSVDEHFTSRRQNVGALVIGIIAVLLTLSLESSFGSTVGNIGLVVTALFPGLLGSMVIASNVHDISLGVAATFNFVFYCGISWVICALFQCHLEEASIDILCG